MYTALGLQQDHMVYGHHFMARSVLKEVNYRKVMLTSKVWPAAARANRSRAHLEAGTSIGKFHEIGSLSLITKALLFRVYI